MRRMLDDVTFGDQVIVSARIVRVVWNGSSGFVEAGRGLGRNRDMWPGDGSVWPGKRIPDDHHYRGVFAAWEVEPQRDDTAVRLRWIRYPLPNIGIVVGRTWLEEGTIVRNIDEVYWSGRRRLYVWEVAMHTQGKHNIVKVRSEDAEHRQAGRGFDVLEGEG